MNFGKRYAKEKLVSAYIYSDYYLTFFEELHTFKCNRGHESAGPAGSFTLSRAEVRRPAATWTHWTLKLSTNLREFLQCPEKALIIENIMMLVCKMEDS